ncbi:MAG: YvcK family protein [Sodalinema sp.]|uniref:gluconeogenesis factor YvcK family protein n=1 Tax=Sodalinema sp. TaxID=3080550 RepID=UPI00120058CA|nr:MAG: YvcK family protein [Phormidium sp. SL48-SHIP]
MKQTIRDLKRVSRSRTPYRAKQWFKWLSPGLSLKRWLVVSATGMVLALLGIAIWTKLTPVYYLLQFVETALTTIATRVPNYISGPLVVISGILLLLWGQTRTMGSIHDALKPEDNGELIDALMERRRLHRGPKIVALGGGTGLSTLLRGIKTYSANITAVVTVADDGGSSGRLRREIGVLPPGDIRNCLAALADEETLLAELFQYRFQGGTGLSGHSFGNLFLAAMADITGDLEQAVVASSQVLAVRGEVLPATLTDVTLWAELADGRRIQGESRIAEARGKIVRVGCVPETPPPLPRVIEAIAEAEVIVIGPGSLYTSVIPNLLVPDIVEAIARSSALRIYVCNIMTEPGETDGYTVSDHILAIDRACGDRPVFDAVVVQKSKPSARSLIRYAQKQSHPVDLDLDVVERLGRHIILANIMSEDRESGMVRHDSLKLARTLAQHFSAKR